MSEPSRRPWVDRLFAPVDIATLVFFRIVFGALMLWTVWDHFALGYIRAFWIDPKLNFKYYGFEWVEPLPGQGLFWLFGMLGVAAACILVGLFYRLSALLFCVGFTYSFLLEESRYMNHNYLICLISLILVFLPAHRSFSLDARRRPSIRSSTVPAWTLFVLQAQVGLVYFYGGVAKINSDWLQGEPMRAFLQDRAHLPVIGPLADEVWLPYFVAYGGLLLDLLIVPLLCWKRTRFPIFLVAIFFHCTNSWLFQIDVFPWFMIAATTLYFPPAWPRQVLGWFAPEMAAPIAQPKEATVPSRTERRWVLGLGGTYLAVQLLLPIRPFLYPGQTLWTAEGQRFSWRMMLRSVTAETWFRVTNLDDDRYMFVDPRLFMTNEQALEMGRDDEKVQAFARLLLESWAPQRGWPRVSVKPVDSFMRFYVVTTPGGPREAVRTPEYFTANQQRKLCWYPDMILQFAHHLAREYRAKGFADVQVFVEAWVSLNGRPHELMIDPDVDMAAQVRSLRPQSWILPLKGTLSG